MSAFVRVLMDICYSTEIGAGNTRDASGRESRSLILTAVAGRWRGRLRRRTKAAGSRGPKARRVGCRSHLELSHARQMADDTIASMKAARGGATWIPFSHWRQSCHTRSRASEAPRTALFQPWPPSAARENDADGGGRVPVDDEPRQDVRADTGRYGEGANGERATQTASTRVRASFIPLACASKGAAAVYGEHRRSKSTPKRSLACVGAADRAVSSDCGGDAERSGSAGKGCEHASRRQRAVSSVCHCRQFCVSYLLAVRSSMLAGTVILI